MVVLVIPSILLGVLPTFAFLLPADLGEKISLGVTVLLAQVVELLVLSDILPPSSSDDFPIFGRLVIYSVILIVFSICESLLVTAVHNISPDTELPSFILFILNSKLMKIAKLPEYGFPMSYKFGTKLREESKSGSMITSCPKQKDKNSGPDPETTAREVDVYGGSGVENKGWVVLAKLIDRLMLILYSVLLIVGLASFCILMNV